MMFDLSTRILVVDDIPAIRRIVVLICKHLGFVDVTEATDGEMGWQALKEASPPIGLIISDWNMPNCSGIDLLKRVRGDKNYAQLPFILVTAQAETNQIVQALEAGASSYVVKPFTAEGLKFKLEAVHRSRMSSLK